MVQLRLLVILNGCSWQAFKNFCWSIIFSGVKFAEGHGPLTREYKQGLDNNQGGTGEDKDWVSLDLVELFTRIILERK